MSSASTPSDRRTSELGLLFPAALVAPRTKVLYLPTTKVACTALKFLIAEAEGSLDESAIDALPTPAVTRSHAIHNVAVSGLRLFASLAEREQRAIIDSDEWWRVGALRDPYARMYSSWENRILLRAPSHYIRSFDAFPDVSTEGSLDVGATFAEFMRRIVVDPRLVEGDDHFRSQCYALRPGSMPLTHLVRVDAEGELAAFAAELSRRAGRDLVLRRLNEGLGISHRDVVTAEVARMIETWSAEDFRSLGFAVDDFPASHAPVLLSPREMRLVSYAREVTERLDRVAMLVHARSGARYGAREVLRRIRSALP